MTELEQFEDTSLVSYVHLLYFYAYSNNDLTKAANALSPNPFCFVILSSPEHQSELDLRDPAIPDPLSKLPKYQRDWKEDHRNKTQE